jgi:hypothetical protein
MIREAVEELGSPTTNVEIRDWIEDNYPGTNRGTIGAQRLACTVNQPSRVHYLHNQSARECDDHRYNFLYCPDRGKIEWYRPERHGVWTIEEDEDGEFAICCDDGELIYPERRERSATEPSTTPRTRAAKPIDRSQIDAANLLHHRCPQWSSTDRAFERMARLFPGWDRESCILKSAVINDLSFENPSPRASSHNGLFDAMKG